MPEVIAPKAAATHTDPYGLGQVRHTGPITVPTNDVTLSTSPAAALDNRVAWISLLFGLVAVGLTLAPALPGSDLWWVGGAAVASLVTGVTAVAGRVAGTASNVVAPVVGVALGAAATVLMVMGIGILGVVNSALAPAPPATASSAALTPASSVEPLVFPRNQTLTANGQILQQIATAMNTAYAGGNSTLAKGQSWPASLEFTPTQVLSADGTVIATIPSGSHLSYQLSANHKSYTFSVSGTNPTQAAIYDSSTNRFTFRCLATDASCVPTH